MTPQDAMYNYFVMGFQMGMFEEPYIQRGVKLGWINQSQANALEMQFFPQHADMTTSQGSASVTMPTSESASTSQSASASASASQSASTSTKDSESIKK